MQKFTTLLRRTHNLLALIVGAQVLLWVASGFFFALRPIEEVRGEHLRSEAHEMIAALDTPVVAPDTVLAAAGEPVMSLRLKPWLGRPVWEADMHSGKAMFDGATGETLTPISEENARRVAEAGWAGEGDLTVLEWIETAPREAGRGAGRAMWKASYGGKEKADFWIDPQTGEIAAVRTSWWRTFDLFWGLHIMDWANRETISTWWMKLFAFGSLVLSLAGIWLVVDRTAKGRLLR